MEIMRILSEKLLHERGSYIRDSVFAASDGIVTTFAVVAGSTGASLDPSVVLILGFANLFADGFSMSAGTYLGVKSEAEYEKAQGDSHIPGASPFKQGLVAFFAFDLAGVVPLIPYIFKIGNWFELSLSLVFIFLFLIGVLKGNYTKKGWLRSGAEMLLIGGLAAVVAYTTGYVIENIILR
jgi:VIT1/CCC1 family predicted Fe2+/Mn2+ transporter